MIRALLIIILSPSLLSAQLARVTPADPMKNAVFGHAVDIDYSGRVAIIGSPGANIQDDIEDFSGTAYVFTREGTRWSQFAKLVPADISRNDAFGSSVALSADGHLAIVGAPLASAPGYASGAAFIFGCGTTGCNELARLAPPVIDPGDLFGMSVAFDESGTVAVIGAPGRGDFAGAVWVFRRDQSEWSVAERLDAENPEARTFFGRTVVISADGQTIWVGEPLHRQRTSSRGAVHEFVLESGNWRRQSILYPENPDMSMFGYSLALSRDGSFGVIGAVGIGSDRESRGSATILRRVDDVWNTDEILEPANPAEAVWFGSSVAVDSSNTFVMIGAPGDSRNGFRSGRAFLFAEWHSLWSPVSELEPDSAAFDDRFGFSMALDAHGDYGFVGARESPVNDFDAGLAYAFGPSTLPVSIETSGPGHSAGAGPDRDDFGIHLYPNPSRDRCRIRVKSSESSVIEVGAYDLGGRKVAKIYGGPSSRGLTELIWDTSGLPPGVYMVRLRSGDREQAVKMVHAR
jgi:hypothetical protein